MTVQTDRILIIGACGGIGKETAKQLTKKGYALILCGRNLTALQRLVDALKSPHPHELIVADIATEKGRTTIAERVRQVDVDTLINIAGINQLVAFADQTTESIEQIMNTNLISTMLLMREVIVKASNNKQLSVINLGSTLGAIGMPGYATYCASKFALRGFCEALSRELSDTEIRIRYFAPRTTKTSMNSDLASAMNAELGNKADSTQVVAKELLAFVNSATDSLHIGWPEKLFVKINAVFPAIISHNFKKQLPIIRKYIG
jgi:short-subunit dehydrogenase